MGCGASRLATAEQQRDEQKGGAAPRDELGPSGDGNLLKLPGSSSSRKGGQDPSSKALVPVVHENDPAASQNPSRMLTPEGGWSHDGAGSVGRDHAPPEQRADDSEVGWPGRSSGMSTMEELKAKEKWLVECGVLQAIALRMPPGPPSGSGYGFAAMSRGWPAAFRGVEDEIVNLVGEGANQLIEAESHCSEQTCLSLAETSSVATAPSETRKCRQPPHHSVVTAPSEVGWSEGGGQRDGIVVAETTMAKPKKVEWALTVDKHSDNQGGVKGEAGDRRLLAGEAGGHQRGEAGMKPQDASWDESQVRGLSMIEARVMSLDRLQNLAEQVALELEVARADLERAIKSGDYGAQANLNRYVVEAEELLNGVRRDIVRLGGGVGGRQGSLAVPDDESMVQIQRRVKAISRLQGLAQETAVELEVARAELAAARRVCDMRRAEAMEERVETAEEVLELVKEDLLQLEREMEGSASAQDKDDVESPGDGMREKLQLQLETRFREIEASDTPRAGASPSPRHSQGFGHFLGPPRVDSSLSLLRLHPPTRIQPPWLALGH